ncbi:GNAT family N-acetyltransferase [Paenibacillus spongiae]|uniref:N-acetyltransferase family protein n=1 Tax=Paenibacillus spongiae TaxID=2909671 RepID=A0ABY5S2V4_9BACL|nr:GNAT family N-acetyltransferase [Paenibacillus spongiae]UVI27989.1 N-acetyltransferase family protein [Paenibacillus spongiae]
MNNKSMVDYNESYLEQARGTYNYYVENTTVSFDLEPVTAEQMHQLIKPMNERYRTLIIQSDGQYAGYILFTQHKKKAAFQVTAEVTIYLDPAFGRRGIGSYAIPYVEQLAREQNIHSFVATICSENEGSIRLFGKLGYMQCAHYREVAYKFGRWLDLLSFQKRFD